MWRAPTRRSGPYLLWRRSRESNEVTRTYRDRCLDLNEAGQVHAFGEQHGLWRRANPPRLPLEQSHGAVAACASPGARRENVYAGSPRRLENGGPWRHVDGEPRWIECHAYHRRHERFSPSATVRRPSRFRCAWQSRGLLQRDRSPERRNELESAPQAMRPCRETARA